MTRSVILSEAKNPKFETLRLSSQGDGFAVFSRFRALCGKNDFFSLLSPA
jgi:hypothetical protein